MEFEFDIEIIQSINLFDLIFVLEIELILHCTTILKYPMIQNGRSIRYCYGHDDNF